jgi:3'5'-cyclic nucleotide phosphodiesterase
LENHHVSAAFILMQEPEMAIFSSFSNENYKKVRERIISMVLATEMTSHFSELAKLKGRLAVSDFDLKEKDKHACMDQIVHAADISNPIKPFNVYFLWTERVLEEFFDQVIYSQKNN